MKESLDKIKYLYCEQICDKWSPNLRVCIWSAINRHDTVCFYTKDQKIKKMGSEMHRLKAWVDSYIQELRNGS
jgi:hypothetical protein